MAWIARDEPFNNLPALPPSVQVETVAVLKKAIIANKYLAELKGSCLRLPNPGLLLNTVILQESKDSSAIENIVTTQDALYQAILNPFDGIPSEVKEVLRYREAMYVGIEEMQKSGLIRSSLAITIMCKLRGITNQGFRTISGTKLSNPQTRKIIYSPPDPNLVATKMGEWEKFLNENEDFDPLVKMALIHYQLEAIHPFSDGNGRTGRILNVLYLIQQNLLTEPVLYHSSYIIQYKSDYYRCLREVTENDAWESWILFMLDAIIETSQRTLKFIDQMLSLKEKTLIIIKTLSQKIPAYELNELLFSFPYLKIKTLIDKNIGTRPTITGYLNTLIEKGVLRTIKVGRENYYINYKLMDMLTKPTVD